MFTKTFQATHPSMIDGIENQSLCDLYQVTGMFAADEINLNYSHNERMVVGGAAPVKGELRLPDQSEPVKGAPFLERRELGAINVGDGGGKIVVDGETYDMEARDGLYIPMGCKDVVFQSDDAKNPAEYYLASTPAHARQEEMTSFVFATSHSFSRDKTSFDQSQTSFYSYQRYSKDVALYRGMVCNGKDVLYRRKRNRSVNIVNLKLFS